MRGPNGWIRFGASTAALSLQMIFLCAEDRLVCRVEGPEWPVSPPDLEVSAIRGDGNRVLFSTSVDLIGENPQRRVQIYRFDIADQGLAQLSHFEIDNALEGPFRADSELQRVVFESRADLTGGNSDHSREIFLLEAQSGQVIQLTASSEPTPQGSRGPFISGDGSVVAFVSNDDLTGANSDHSSEIFAAFLDRPPGSDRLSQITSDTPAILMSRPVVDDSGNRVVFVRRDLFGGQQLRSVGLSLSTTQILFEGRALGEPYLSLDGGRIVFAATSDPTGGNHDRSVEVFSLAANGEPVLIQLTHSPEGGDLGAVNVPSISSDGNRVFFASRLDFSGDNPQGFFQLFGYDVGARSLIQVSGLPGGVLTERPAVSKEGRRVVFALSRDPSGASPQAGRDLRWADCRLEARPELVFPQVASGGGITTEVILTNSGPETEQGEVLFFNASGDPLDLGLNQGSTGRFPFELVPGGVLKLKSGVSESLRTGFGLIHAKDGRGLAGTLVFELNGGEVSVPGSAPGKEFHFLAEIDEQVNSGIALVNLSGAPSLVSLTLFSTEGLSIRTQSLSLAHGERVARFIDELFPDLPLPFLGTLHARSDDLFGMVGVRQRLADGSLSVLGGSESAFPDAGSHLVYLLDTGINLNSLGFSREDREGKTVQGLLGPTSPANRHLLEVRNLNSNQSVTLAFRYLNDRCHSVLAFLLTLECGQRLLFDPFDLLIPGIGISTAERFFGDGNSLGAIEAIEFGSGRFVLWVGAVGRSLNADRSADLLFPHELSPQSCLASTSQVGGAEGVGPANLHVCNARLMSFDYLKGSQRTVNDIQCGGPTRIGASRLRQAMAPVGRLSLDPVATIPCLGVPPTGFCQVLAELDRLGSTQCAATRLGPTAIIKSSDPTFSLSMPDN